MPSAERSLKAARWLWCDVCSCVDEAALLSRLLLCTSLLAWAMAVTCALAAFGPYWRSSVQWWLRRCRRKTGRAAERKGGKDAGDQRTVTAVGLDVTDL